MITQPCTNIINSMSLLHVARGFWYIFYYNLMVGLCAGGQTTHISYFGNGLLAKAAKPFAEWLAMEPSCQIGKATVL